MSETPSVPASSILPLSPLLPSFHTAECSYDPPPSLARMALASAGGGVQPASTDLVWRVFEGTGGVADDEDWTCDCNEGL
eukprot:591650-Pyramimonas_sp.AAC.1